MMAVALVLGQVAPAASPPADPQAADEVVVIGQRLRRWTGKVGTALGITTCRTTVSTGDREIDAIGCDVLKTCWAEYRPAYAAARAEKRAGGTAQVEAMLGRCLKEKRDVLVAGLADRRAATGARP